MSKVREGMSGSPTHANSAACDLPRSPGVEHDSQEDGTKGTSEFRHG